MNLNLNYEGFENFLLFRKITEWKGGVAYRFRFENGYGASIVKHHYSYGHEQDLWELAVLEFRGREDALYGELCYDTEITDDVVGYLTDEKVRELLAEIKAL